MKEIRLTDQKSDSVSRNSASLSRISVSLCRTAFCLTEVGSASRNPASVSRISADSVRYETRLSEKCIEALRGWSVPLGWYLSDLPSVVVRSVGLSVGLTCSSTDCTAQSLTFREDRTARQKVSTQACDDHHGSSRSGAPRFTKRKRKGEPRPAPGTPL